MTTEKYVMNRKQIKRCRAILSDRLDALTIMLKGEGDSLKADAILVEMRAIGDEMLNLRNSHVSRK